MLAKFERLTVNVWRVMIVFQNLCKLVSSHALTCLSVHKLTSTMIYVNHITSFLGLLIELFYLLFYFQKLNCQARRGRNKPQLFNVFFNDSSLNGLHPAKNKGDISKNFRTNP